MNKQEINEIRKQLSYENCTIDRICGCYVDGEKNIQTTSKDSFLALPEEEGYKYFDLFKKVLSGTMGKNLINMEFPLESEAVGGPQEFLLRLRDSKLEDEALLQEFYERVIANYIQVENYYIVLVHATYDVPGKASDGMELFDASDNVYEYLLCAICPVKLAKAGLYYNAGTNQIEDRVRDRVVDMPLDGFLFPAFHDRNSDIHSMLYYAKKPEELQRELIDNVFGTRQPVSAGGQKESFQMLVMDTLDDECDFDTVKEIHENLYDMIAETKEDPEPLTLAKPEVRKLLERSGVSNEKLAQFEDHFAEDVIQQEPLQATNIVNTRQFAVSLPDVSIKVKPEHTGLIRTRQVDGRMCLVIDVTDQVEINGVPVRVNGTEMAQALHEELVPEEVQETIEP